jgi:beta-glucanase (GH16 family)
MKRQILVLLSSLILGFGWAGVSTGQGHPPPAQAAPAAAATEDSPWRLVWADEFDTDGPPDPKKWGYDVGGHGWGNNELQHYTEGRLENARVEDGHLIVEARRDQWEGHEYTSARLVTRGRASWRYGRIEVRARLPRGRGTWPAIWMLPRGFEFGKSVWPDAGEIDIMEHVGYDEGVVHGTVHCRKYYSGLGNQKGAQIQVPDAPTAFHDYALEWYPDRIEVLMDDTLYFTYPNEGTGPDAWPFDKPFYLILNIAVGGHWGGAQGVDPDVYPQRLVVDHVRVYEAE